MSASYAAKAGGSDRMDTIQAIKIDALTHPDEWTRKLQARVILLTIYEWDADEVSGRALAFGTAGSASVRGAASQDAECPT
jgi:hypothetical protein